MERSNRSTSRVEAALRDHGLDAVVSEMPGSTRTAADAATAVGCTVGQIAKSLVFVTQSGQTVLAITSGSNRVDPSRLAEHVGEPVGMADPRRVREVTGYAIGGVPPLGLSTAIPVFIDRDLLAYEEIWAAAGTPRSVFKISPEALVGVTNGTVASFAEGG